MPGLLAPFALALPLAVVLSVPGAGPWAPPTPRAVFAGGAGPLTGTVRTADGRPVAGAEVVLATTQHDTTRTDAAGAFTFADVTFPVVVEVSAVGFAHLRQVIASSPAALTVAPEGVAESVVVTADRAEAWRDPVTGATVLDDTDLAQLPAVTLDEALRAVSGFSLYRRSSAPSANPTTQGVTMRGLSASGESRGLVLLDGIPFTDGFGDWVTWSRLPDDAVGRVDVERGSAGDAYGTDAMGGVVRIVTPSVERALWSIGAEVGSMDVETLDVSGGDQIGNLSFFGAATGFHSTGSIPTAPAARGPIDVPAGATWQSGLGKMTVRGSGYRLTIEGWGGSDDWNNGTPIQVNTMSGGTFATTFDAATGPMTVAARVSVTPNAYYQTFSSVNAARTVETLTSTQNISTDTVRGTLEVGRAVPRGHLLLVASTARDAADFTTTPPNPATPPTTDVLRDDTEALAVEATTTPAARWSIDGGLREDWRAAPTAGASHDTDLVGHLATVWQLSDAFAVKGSEASSQRWPTLNELVRPFQQGGTLTLANPNLLPEQSVSTDGSVQATHSFWLVSAGGFHTIVDNAVENVTQPAGTVKGFSGIVRMRENAGQLHATGGELDAEIRAGTRARLRGSLTAMHAEVLDSIEPALEGNRPPQVPRLSAAISGDFTPIRAVTGAFVFHAVSSQFDDDLNQFLLAPAYQLDLQASGRHGALEWRVIVENALNNQIQTALSPILTLAPPRAFRVGLTWRH